MKKLFVCLIVCVWTVAASASYLTIYDSLGFENFTLGTVEGQTGGSYLNPGAKEGGAFDVTGGPLAGCAIVDSGTSRGKVFSINYGGLAGSKQCYLDLGWQGDTSNPVYADQTKYVHLTFDFLNTGVPGTAGSGVSGAITTYRGADHATAQAKVFLQENPRITGRKDSTTAANTTHNVVPSISLGQWHKFTLTTIWDAGATWPKIEYVVDGVKLNVANENNTWYTSFNGISGWFDAIYFSYLANDGAPLLIDNMKVMYSNEPIPEPATMVILAMGGIATLLTRKRS